MSEACFRDADAIVWWQLASVASPGVELLECLDEVWFSLVVVGFLVFDATQVL